MQHEHMPVDIDSHMIDPGDHATMCKAVEVAVDSFCGASYSGTEDVSLYSLAEHDLLILI